jgi:DNA repair protein RecN (Recombination protein N)
MLGLQKLLAGKDAISTLVFDEIDANIGGETAAVIGDKLAEISQYHQVLCITHFPQVAMRAKHHLQISKQETNGRTFTMVKVLGSKERKQELSRMVGVK